MYGLNLGNNLFKTIYFNICSFSDNKSEETNQKPAGGLLSAHFKRYLMKSQVD